MHFLSSLKDLFIDFLFPKTRKVLELEALSTGTLLEILPPAQDLKDGNVIALFDYAHPLVKELIWELKYSGNPHIAEKLGEIAFDHLRQELEDRHFFGKWGRPIIIPIPMSGKRQSERGWNQSELLAEEIVKRDSEKIFKYMPRQLIKVRHTESQTKTASRNERLQNLTDSMKIANDQSVKGRSVILLDDVTTTGATFAEARRALGAAGAPKILCLALAH
ncbi:MAG: hypothetical protein WD896_01290 [Parcubacteria group bacterium]